MPVGRWGSGEGRWIGYGVAILFIMAMVITGVIGYHEMEKALDR